MNWDDLKLFLAVARCGTISGAAKQFNVQHTTVSRRIKKLEQTLGTSLLTRKNNVYQLTEQGARIESAAIKMESELLEVDGTLQGQNDSLVGPLRIATISTMSSSVLMPILNEFSQKHPKINLDVIVSNDPISLANREADVAIRWTNKPPEMLIGKRVVTIASTIYGSEDYVKKVKDTGSEQWIGAKCCDFHDSWTKQTAKEKKHQFTSNDSATILSAVQSGLGLTFLPCFIGDNDPLLKRYCEPDPIFDLGLWVLIHPELKNNLRILAFRNHLIDAIKQQQSSFEGV